MGHRFMLLVRLCWKDGVGLALFLAWVYCSLFGCGLATHAPELVGLPTTHSLERIWLYAGLAEAVGGCVGLARTRLRARSGRKAPERDIAALVLGVLGSVVVWAAWINRTVWFGRLFWIGGLLMGFAAARFTMAWGVRLSSVDEARIEFTTPLAFTLSFALYLLVLLFKQSSVATLAIVVAMCAGSFCALFRNRAGDALSLKPAGPVPNRAPSDPVPAVDPRNARWGLVSFGALAGVLWVQIAFFRVVSSPAVMGDRFTHYLYPFLAACAVSFVILVLCIRISRYLNVTLAYRWGLPLFVIGYVPLIADYTNPTLRVVGYAINFLGMFGVQFGCWLGASKYARRARVDARGVFACYAIGEGLGVFAGCRLGLCAVAAPFEVMAVASFALLGAVQLVAMVAGFNPAWTFKRTSGARPWDALCDDARGCAAAASANGEAACTTCAERPDGTALDELFHQEALWLQATYALTNRETEVAALLLAGRTRPFIRDELFLSLNTVGVHVRNIFSKCGVHSQQELIDLARGVRQ